MNFTDNPAAQKKLEALQRRALNRHENNIRVLMRQREFREYVWNLVHQRAQPMNIVGVVPNETAQYMNGRGDLAKELWAEVSKLCPTETKTMTSEAIDTATEESLHQQTAKESNEQKEVTE